MKLLSAFLGVISLVFSGSVLAQIDASSAVRVESDQVVEPQGLEKEYSGEVLRLRSVMQGYFPLKQIVAVESIAEGRLYQVRFASGLILYTLPGGEYFVAGNIFRAAPEGVIDLSKQLRQQENARLLAALQPSDYLVLPAIDPLAGEQFTGDEVAADEVIGQAAVEEVVPPIESEQLGEAEVGTGVTASVTAENQPAKKLIYVFVDIDCYYCQFQHQESALLTAAGVEVRYLSYNRQKPGSSAFHKVRRTWCSQEPQAALDMMMQGRSLAAQSCSEGLMDKHIALAKALDIKRLPAVVTVDGRVTEGLLRAPQIFNLLGIEPSLEAEEDSGLDIVETGSRLEGVSPASL